MVNTCEYEINRISGSGHWNFDPWLPLRTFFLTMILAMRKSRRCSLWNDSWAHGVWIRILVNVKVHGVHPTRQFITGSELQTIPNWWWKLRRNQFLVDSEIVNVGGRCTAGIVFVLEGPPCGRSLSNALYVYEIIRKMPGVCSCLPNAQVRAQAHKFLSFWKMSPKISQPLTPKRLKPSKIPQDHETLKQGKP